MLLKRLVMVLVLSSAAKIPLCFATNACAVAAKLCGVHDWRLSLILDGIALQG